MVLVLAGLWVFLPRWVIIRRIDCFTQYDRCDLSLGFDPTTLSGKSYREVKLALRQNFKENLLIQDYAWRFLFPNRLRLDLLVKKPKFALKNESEAASALVGTDSVVLTRTPETNLPYLTVAEVLPQKGERVSQPQLFAAGLMEKIFYLYQVRQGNLVEDRLEVTFPDGNRVIFPLEGDPEVLIGALRLILPEVKGKVVDLRFKNPIIR